MDIPSPTVAGQLPSPPKTLQILHVREGEGTAAVHLGPYRIDSLVPPEQEAAVTAYRVRIEPNQQTAVSYHLLAEELYYVLSGTAVAVLDGVEHQLQPGDFLRLPPGVRHGFITGNDPLLMLDVHTPGSRPDRDVYFVGETPPGFGTGG